MKREQEAPTASPNRWPYREHRTLEQVDKDLELSAWKERYREIARQNLRDWRKKPRG